MNWKRVARSLWLLPAQCGLAAALIALVALIPPANGAIMLVSLDGTGRDAVSTWQDADARLLGAGPLPHSLIVLGSRARLSSAAWRHRSFIITGLFAGCGKTQPV